MTEPTRVSAAADLPTPADDGTPAGLPTPAGEPAQIDDSIQTGPIQASLPLKAARPAKASRALKPVKADNDTGRKPRAKTRVPRKTPLSSAPAPAPIDPARTPCHAIGALVMAWGALEAATVDKLIAMRRAFGDVRAVGGRSRPTLQRLLAELRALVAMRDRHNKQVLTVIAALDGDLQRLAQFRTMVVDGSRLIDRDAVICHDLKNAEHRVPVRTIASETRRITAITAQISAL